MNYREMVEDQDARDELIAQLNREDFPEPLRDDDFLSAPVIHLRVDRRWTVEDLDREFPMLATCEVPKPRARLVDFIIAWLCGTENEP